MSRLPAPRFLFLALALALAAVAPAQTRGGQPPTTELDDKPETLAAPPRNEAERDRLDALALFAAARNHQQRGEEAVALRLYQRAYRRDRGAGAIVRAIVPLAYQQGHFAEAVRYAVKSADFDDADPLLLRRLGVLLSDEGDWPGAVKLYERALAARGAEKQTAADVLLQMEMGRLYHLADERRKAADSYDRVLAALEKPKDHGIDDKIRDALLGEAAETYMLMGDAYLEADRPADALRLFEKAHQATANAALLAFNRARVLAHEKKSREALAELEKAFVEKLSNEGTEPYELFAALLDKLGQPGVLIERLEKLRTAGADNAPLAYFLAEQYEKAGREADAATVYRQIVPKSPTVAGFRALARIAREQKQAGEWLSVAGQVVGETGLLGALGEQLKALVNDKTLLDAVIAHARRALKDEADKFGYHNRVAAALVALEAKQFDAAAEFFEAALKSQDAKPAEILLDWGVGLLASDRFDEAAKVLERGVAAKGARTEIAAFHFYLAAALEMSGKTDAAIAAALKAARSQNDSARFQGRAAWVNYHAKRYDAAIAGYNKLVEKFDKDHKSNETRDVLREARLALSNLHVLKEQLPEAEEWLEQVLDEFPDDAGALNDLGYLWAEQNKHLGRALWMVEKAVADEPDNAAFRDSLGWVYFRLGRYSEALKELQKAAADRPDAVVLDHLGDVHRAIKETAQAADAYRRAAKAFRDEKEEKKAAAVEKKLNELKK